MAKKIKKKDEKPVQNDEDIAKIIRSKQEFEMNITKELFSAKLNLDDREKNNDLEDLIAESEQHGEEYQSYLVPLKINKSPRIVDSQRI
ncbi:hypothetical protein Ob7_06648 [Thermosipho africanus Ob7]|uniref:hypothetical protein n=1 Tax=Thermosipho africanus TaxID=2421 RepID=UPI000E0C7D64|nr:hypothetical protein [Thermosipho africanus]RDI91119.1 hypothetical protein Ob7_06648 [Thermosipho africanus Ob7]